MASTFSKALSQVTGESIKSKVSKATQDDETPTPGYLQEELKRSTHESATCCELEDHILGRLQVKSSNVKVLTRPVVVLLAQFLRLNGS
jgi:hypothetical protein